MRTDSRIANRWSGIRGQGRRVVAKLARRVLPNLTVSLAHVEPELRLRVSVRRNVMFWSGGLARYETECVRILRACVEPGDSVMDIGANIGFFTTLLSRWAGPQGRVAAVEPDAENLRLLRSNVSVNHCDNVAVVPRAIGAKTGNATFSRDHATGATGHLGSTPTAGETAVGRRRVDLVPIEVETLDSLAADLGGRIAVVKIDIEGGESAALAGATQTLAQHRPFILSELGGEGGRDAANLLRTCGYLLWDAESGRPVSTDDAPFLVLAIPEEQLETDRGRRALEACRVGGSPP